MRYQFAFVVTGQVEAPSEEHARQQVLMGASLSARLAASPALEIAVTIAPVEEQTADAVRRGPVPVQMQVLDGRDQG